MKQNTKTILLLLLAILLFAAAGACGYLFYLESRKPNELEQYDYEAVQELVTVIPVTKADPEQEPEQSDVLQYDLEALLAQNDDFTGWLYIPDGNINLPVVAGSDNDWYLRRSFTGEYSVFGCPFLDINTPNGSRNRVIHGHNMGKKRTEMFSRLLDYTDQSYAQEHNLLYYSEPGVEGEVYEIFAVLNFDTNKLDEFNYFQANFETEDEFLAFVSYLKDHSLYKTDFIPSNDTLILSTCNRTYGEDNRFLVCAGKLDSHLQQENTLPPSP